VPFTFTPHVGQLTRRMRYSRKTIKPQSGTNSKRRTARWSYVGAGVWHMEHFPLEPTRSRISSSMLLVSPFRRAATLTKPGKW